MSGSLPGIIPGIIQPRASQARALSADPVRDGAPTMMPSDRNRSAAGSFATMLGDRLAAGRATTAAATRAEARAGHHDDDDRAPASPTALTLTEADLRAAGLAAVAMGAGGIGATADQGAGDSATGAGDTEATMNAAAGDTTAAPAQGTVAAAAPIITATETAVASERATATEAAAAIAAAAAAGPARPTRDLDAVAPELRDRVARVVERMRDEFGIEVEVSEGYRTQARQNALHAQGRSAPGPVVTWTRNSKHTLGRAVDVTVNGGYSDTRGFATLQRVAREEGLHTLGMRDPGHLELPASVAGSARPAAIAGAMGGVDLATLAQLAGDAGARVESLDVELAPSTTARAAGATVATAAAAQSAGTTARVAPVATVAQVATVARVARVAAPGTRSTGGVGAAGDRGAGVGSRSAASAAVGRVATAAATTTAEAAAGVAREASATAVAAQPATGSTAPVAAAQMAAAGGHAVPTTRRDEAAIDERAGEGAGATSGGDNGALYGGDGSRDRGSATGAARMAPVVGAATADAIARLDRIDALRDGSAARPLSHLTLTLDNAAGGSDRIRVDVRGSQMGAVLELSDPVLRDRVSSNLGELQHALEQRGLQSDGLQVRRAGIGATTTDALDMSRIAGATLERENVRAGSNANPGQSSTHHRERDDRQHSDGPRDDSSPRQRSRREPKENHK